MNRRFEDRDDLPDAAELFWETHERCYGCGDPVKPGDGLCPECFVDLAEIEPLEDEDD